MLIEIVVAIAMVATIALPLLTVFLQSAKADHASNNLLNANYISQNYVERLDGMTYMQALQNLPNREQVGDYYLTAKIRPYGPAFDAFETSYNYAQIVYFDDGSVLTVMPDGKWRLLEEAPTYYSLLVSEYGYYFSGGGTDHVGSCDANKCLLQINAMERTQTEEVTISFDYGIKSVLYCKQHHADDFSFSHENETYKDMTDGSESMIYVETKVYETASAERPVASYEGYIYIKNW